MEKNIPPQDALISASGVTWLNNNGILIAIANHQDIHTLDNAIENHRINVMLAAGKPRPFLIDISKVKTMSREAREFYSRSELKEAINAVAILTNSSVGKYVANFFLMLTTQAVPTKMFNDSEEAMEWLVQFK